MGWEEMGTNAIIPHRKIGCFLFFLVNLFFIEG